MREILFTGKRVDNGEWVGGFYVFVPEHYKPEMSRKSYIVSINNGLYFEVVPETVGQYTGTDDKYGDKIFEGSIVQYNIDEIGEILWDKPTARFVIRGDVAGYDFNNFYGKELVVIGNIHDNPELLEV